MADCLFSGIPFLPKEVGVPLISIGVVPLIQTSKDLAPSGLGMVPSRSFLGKLKQEALKKMADHLLFRKPNRIFFILLVQYQIPHQESNAFDSLINSATLFLRSGTPSFEYERSDLGKNIRYIGPVLPWINPENVTKKTFKPSDRSYKRTVLATQGTVEKDVEKLLVPTLEAFRNDTET